MQKISVPPEMVRRVKAIARSDSRVGALWHYHLLAKDSLPLHTVGWIHEYFTARAAGDDLAVEAFRGSLKTTVFSGYLTSYGVAMHPELETVLVQASDKQAEENMDFLSSLIKDNPGWKFLYPEIAPDERRWGAKGYEVKDSSMTYGEWRQKRTKTPSFFGAGYKSQAIVGHHPRLHFMRDDINSLRNTQSPREMQAVNKAVFVEQKPAADRAMIEIDVFTPWAEGDVGDQRKKVRHVRVIRTPVTVDGTPKGEPTWPEFFGRDAIDRLMEDLPPAEFALAYLLNREAMQGQALKRGWLRYYPHEEIKDEWPAYIGIDYASVAKEQSLKGRDYFVLLAGRIHPQGFLILSDGFRGQIPRAEAEDICLEWGQQRLNAKGQFRTMGIEGLGKGEDFANWMISHAPFHVKKQGVGNRPKGERFEYEMAPVFRAGQVRISNDPNVDVLSVFEKEWVSWNGDERAGHDDTLDAAYHLLMAAKFRFKPRREEKSERKEGLRNPYQAFAMP